MQSSFASSPSEISDFLRIALEQYLSCHLLSGFAAAASTLDTSGIPE
jgi:hypothetical protein